MVAGRVHLAAGRPPSIHHEPVGPFIGRDAHLAQACHERGDAVTLFHAKLAGARHLECAAERGPRREDRQLVDEARHFLGLNHGRQMVVVHDVEAADRLAGGFAGDFTIDPRTHAFERAQEAQPVRIEQDAFDAHA